VAHVAGFLYYNITYIPTDPSSISSVLFGTLDTDFIFVMFPEIYDTGTPFDPN
jgi:hypothetical protein